MSGVNVGVAYLTVAPSAKGFAGKLSSEIGGGMTAAGEKAGGQASKGFGTRFAAGVNSAIKMGAVALVAGAGLFAKGAVDAASNAQQSLGATESVFKKSADTIVGYSENAATKYGLSANTYRESANLIGSLFKNQGVEAGKLAGQTDRMISLGSDLSATFGGSTKEAVEALSAAYRGEYNQVERYGISLNETAVNAELAKRGQDKLTGAALAAAKQQAKTDIIMRQSKDSLGAFGRESNTLAGQQQRLAAKFENVQSQAGELLLPALTKLAAVVADKVLPAVKDFIEGFKNGEGAGGRFAEILGTVTDGFRSGVAFVEKYQDILVPLAAAITAGATALWAIGAAAKAYAAVQTVLNVVLSANPIGLVIIAIAALAAGLIVAYKKSDTFRAIVKGAFEAIGKAAQFMWNNVVAPVIRFLIKAFASVADFYAALLRGMSKIPGFGWAAGAADKLQNVANKARGIADGIRDIPSRKDVTVQFNVRGTGQVKLPGGTKVDVGQWKARANGGPVRAGGAYAVGDNPDGSWNPTTELFVPDRSGMILNQRQLAGMGGGLSRADIQALTVAVERAHLSATISAGTVDRSMAVGMR